MRQLIEPCSKIFLKSRTWHICLRPSNVHQYCTKPGQADKEQFKIKTFGALKTRTGALCNVNIKPVDPQKFPDQNLAYVEFDKARLGLKIVHWDEGLTIKSDNSKRQEPAVICTDACNIEVPIKFDVDASVEKSCGISVSNLDNDTIAIRTEDGLCELNKILTGTCSVTSTGGDIVCRGILQANTELITSGNGKIEVSKPLSRYFVATTSAGDIKIKSLYADESRLNTETGNVELVSAHRSVHVNISKSGNLNIGSLDGSLTAELNNGNVKVHVSRHTGVHISVIKGDIDLSVTDTLNSKLDLRGHEVTVDEQLNTEKLEWKKSGELSSVTEADGILIIAFNSLNPNYALEHRTHSIPDSRIERIKLDAKLEKVSLFHGVLQSGASKAEPLTGLPTLKAHTQNGKIVVTQQDWFSALKLFSQNNIISKQ